MKYLLLVCTLALGAHAAAATFEATPRELRKTYLDETPRAIRDDEDGVTFGTCQKMFFVEGCLRTAGVTHDELIRVMTKLGDVTLSGLETAPHWGHEPRGPCWAMTRYVCLQSIDIVHSKR